MKLHPRWTQHLTDPEAKEKLANIIVNSRLFSDRLRVILLEEIKSVERSETLETYEGGDWAFKQAHRNGYYRALAKIKQLLEFPEAKIKNK